MFKDNFMQDEVNLEMPVSHPISRSQAMTELAQLGYTSDSKNWNGLIRLLEAGYIQANDLQNHPQ